MGYAGQQSKLWVSWQLHSTGYRQPTSNPRVSVHQVQGHVIDWVVQHNLQIEYAPVSRQATMDHETKKLFSSCKLAHLAWNVVVREGKNLLVNHVGHGYVDRVAALLRRAVVGMVEVIDSSREPSFRDVNVSVWEHRCERAIRHVCSVEDQLEVDSCWQ